MELGDKIKKLRKEKKMTLEQLGDLVGVGKSTVRKWETGMIANMRRDKIAKLAKALDTSPGYLMGWEEEPQKLATYFDVSPDNIINVHTTASDKHILITKNKDISNAYELWSNAFHDVNFTVDEMNEIITFAKFILSKRKKE